MKNGEEDADDVQTNNPTPETDRRRFAERLEAAGVPSRRFIDVRDGEKGTRTAGHQEAINWMDDDDDSLSGNYGVHPGYGVIEFDKDDYNNEHNTEALDALPDTFSVESPHTDGDDPGHDYYAVEDDDAVKEVLQDIAGTLNPEPTWGEVKYNGKYVVGPGSQLDGCSKEWCDECDDPDGGYYRIAEDRPIATLSAEDIAEVLRADPEIVDRQRAATDVFDLPPEEEEEEERESDEWMTEELAEQALEEISPDVDYPEWAAIGFALSNHFGEGRGGRLFREWSKGGMKWDADADRLAARIIEDANKYPHDISAFVRRGKEHGWDASAAARKATAAPSDEGAPSSDPNPRGSNGESGLWHSVRLAYAEDGKAQGRLEAARVLDSEYAWLHVLDTDDFLTYDEDTGQFHDRGFARAKNILIRNLDTFYSTTERDEIVDRLEGLNQARERQLNARDQDEPLLCVGDGVVNLKTGELRDHDPKYKFIRGLEWEYEPDNYEPDTESVLDFVDDITRGVDDRDTLLDHLAHGLIPGHPWRAFVMLYGPGGNGKTQLGEMFMGFVGKQNVANVKLTDLCEGDFATGSLPGKFINIGDDVDGGTIENLGTLKSLTGSGRILGNAKWKSREEFTSEAAMFFSANEPPRFAEDKDSIDDRLYPIRLPYQYKDESEYDPDKSYHKRKRSAIGEELANDEAAMSGLLNLCVEHAQRLFATDGEYSMPEDPAERREIYRAASDPFKRFLRECLTEAGPDDGVLKDDAYSVYTRMCDADDERAMNKDSFKNRKFPEQTVIDYENWRTPTITPGDERQMAYQYLQFTEEAEKYMDDRLAERYFGDDDAPTEGDAGETEAEADVETVDAPYNAIPVAEVPNAPTGFATVTVRLGKARDLTAGESMGASIPATDSTGSIPVITWDERMRTALKSAETEYVALRDVEVDEYQGQDQLKALDGTTTIVPVQQGVGYTREERDPDQFDVEDFTDVPVDATGTQADMDRLIDFMTDRSEPTTTAEVAGQLGIDPDRADYIIRQAANKGRIHKDGAGDGWVATE